MRAFYGGKLSSRMLVESPLTSNVTLLLERNVNREQEPKARSEITPCNQFTNHHAVSSRESSVHPLIVEPRRIPADENLCFQCVSVFERPLQKGSCEEDTQTRRSQEGNNKSKARSFQDRLYVRFLSLLHHWWVYHAIPSLACK